MLPSVIMLGWQFYVYHIGMATGQTDQSCDTRYIEVEDVT